MNTDELKRIPAAEDILEHHRFYQACILSGPADSTRSAAELLARAMVCTGQVSRPCDQCANCVKAMHNAHPDIFALEKEPEKKELTVEPVRDLRSDVMIRPNESSEKIYIIYQADTMNTSAQNALLKILEEPPVYAHFLLVAENADRLLATIRSRCVEIALRPQAQGAAPADEESEKTAEAFLRALQAKERCSFVSFVFSLEKMDKLAFASFGEAVIRQATAMMKNNLAGKVTPLSRPQLAKLLRLFDEFGHSQELNLGVGNFTGMILAEFA